MEPYNPYLNVGYATNCAYGNIPDPGIAGGLATALRVIDNIKQPQEEVMHGKIYTPDEQLTLRLQRCNRDIEGYIALIKRTHKDIQLIEEAIELADSTTSCNVFVKLLKKIGIGL